MNKNNHRMVLYLTCKVEEFIVILKTLIAPVIPLYHVNQGVVMVVIIW